jgi:hypothetical protein
MTDEEVVRQFEFIQTEKRFKTVSDFFQSLNLCFTDKEKSMLWKIAVKAIDSADLTEDLKTMFDSLQPAKLKKAMKARQLFLEHGHVFESEEEFETLRNEAAKALLDVLNIPPIYSETELDFLGKKRILKQYNIDIQKINESNKLEVFTALLLCPNVGVGSFGSINEPHAPFLPVLHGKAMDAIARMSGSKPTPNPLNNTASIERGEVKLIINSLDTLSGTLGVSTHKLLSTAIASFTAQNHTGTGKDRSLREAKVAIPLKEYAIQCGYDVEEHPTDTPEEAAKEAKRAKNTLDNFRRKVKKDLELLYNASISWKEKVKGKEADFADIRILGGKGIRAGYINLEFTMSLAEYLIQLPLSQYPQALLLLDERNDNAYNIGLKMSEHYSNDNNQIRGTAQLLKVKTLLEYTSLPTISTIRKQRTSWEARIKEPFETALDALTACGLLEDWRYSHSKGAEMTDEEATNFKDFDEWAETLVYFTLRNAPNHAPRLATRAAEKKARQAKTKRKRSPKKKDNQQS